MPKEIRLDPEGFKALRDVTEDEEFQVHAQGRWIVGTPANKRLWAPKLYAKVRPKRQRWVADGGRVFRGPVTIYVADYSITPGGTACGRARRLADLLNREKFE